MRLITLAPALLICAACVSSPPPQATPSNMTVPSPTHLALPTSAQIVAPSANVSWIMVGEAVLYVSIDRAATWRQRFLPAGALSEASIAFVNAREGWLMTAGTVGLECSSESVTIWHTADGAATWHQLDPAGIGSDRCKGGLSFADALHGFLAAWDLQHSPVIYRTSDGGKTWAPSSPLPDPPGVSFSGGQAMTPGFVRAFGQDLLVAATGLASTGSCQPKLASPGACVTRTFVFSSADGGATWSYRAAANFQGEPVGMVTEARWLQIRGPGQATETTDGGKTWHAFLCDFSQVAAEAPTLVFADGAFGFATAQGALEKTFDGGAHWIPIQTPGT